MNKRILPLMLAVCLTLCGCASLLERSYSSVEPYTDRYWDSGAADTLKAESYQDLVNSLLMLIEQRSEEAVIRYYAPEGADSYAQATSAKHEVQNETILGSYLLRSLAFTYSSGEGYCTLTYHMTYRDDIPDLSTLMALSDSQSLVDLLRLAVREGHTSLTAQFISKISREEVLDAVNRLWEELYLDELEESGALDPQKPEDDAESALTPPEDDPTAGIPDPDAQIPLPQEDPEDEPDSGDEAEETEDPVQGSDNETGETGENGGEGVPAHEEPTEPVIEIPPCPWTIIFYPDTTIVELVEIVLN